MSNIILNNNAIVSSSGSWAIGPQSHVASATHTFNNSSLNIYTYEDLKQRVRDGFNILQIIRRCPVGQPRYIIVDMWKRAKQEIWAETEPHKTTIGKWLYK